jgi:hypothetical protein
MSLEARTGLEAKLQSGFIASEQTCKVYRNDAFLRSVVPAHRIML